MLKHLEVISWCVNINKFQMVLVKKKKDSWTESKYSQMFVNNWWI